MGDDLTVGYVALTNGYATVDLSDPTNPSVLHEERNLLADRSGGPLQQIYDVKVDGSTFVVAGPANSGELNAFIVYDVSDPANPSRQTVKEVDSSTHNCFVDGNYLYKTGNYQPSAKNPMRIYDLSQSDAPKVAEWSLFDVSDDWFGVNVSLRNLHDIYVHDGYAYLAYWDAGTWIVDVSDPTNPAYVSHIADNTREELSALHSSEVDAEFIGSPGNSHYTTVNEGGTLLAVGKESWQPQSEPERGPGGVDLVDISDKSNPTKLSTIEPAIPDDGTQSTGVETTAHNVDIHGERLYSTWYQNGVKVHDISDPSNPELLAHWRQPQEKSFWAAVAVQPGQYFAATNHSSVRGTDASLMVFPDEAGTQEDMPVLEPSPTPTPSPTTSHTPSPEPTETDTPSPTVANTVTLTPESSPTGTTETSSPGFGPLAALGGLGIGAWRVLWKRRDD